MLFSSIPFLFYFLPAVLLVYYIVPRCLKNTVLLLSSLFFYGWGEPRYLLFMLISITQGYMFGRLIERYRPQKWAKLFLTASVLVCLGLLGICKYADFFLENFNRVTGLSVPLLKIALPIGISFYTFQILSYTVDVYRGTVKAQHNFINLAMYIAMFPQLIAGPIVRYADIEPQLVNRPHRVDDIALGARRFLLGLAKKVLLANTLGELTAIFKASEEPSVLFAWLYAIAFMMHIYFDFSGYSDMAIGLGHLFGFTFPENFSYPYLSASITEFWRRWHISLGTWFRDYVYIPLGGSRVTKPRWLFNLFVVWMATGLWHGAAWTFILWGLLFAVLLMVEKLWLLPVFQRKRVWGHIYTLFFVLIGFVLFDAVDLSAAFQTLQGMFGGAGWPAVTTETLYYAQSYGVILLLGVMGATPLCKNLYSKLNQSRSGAAILCVLEPVTVTSLLVLCTAFLVDGSFNPFLYFRF